MKLGSHEAMRQEPHYPEPKPQIDRKRVEIQRNLIDACDTLLDYIHDDIPHSKQEPLMRLLTSLKRNLEDEMEDATE